MSRPGARDDDRSFWTAARLRQPATGATRSSQLASEVDGKCPRSRRIRWGIGEGGPLRPRQWKVVAHTRQPGRVDGLNQPGSPVAGTDKMVVATCIRGVATGTRPCRFQAQHRPRTAALQEGQPAGRPHHDRTRRDRHPYSHRVPAIRLQGDQVNPVMNDAVRGERLRQLVGTRGLRSQQADDQARDQSDRKRNRHPDQPPSRTALPDQHWLMVGRAGSSAGGPGHVTEPGKARRPPYVSVGGRCSKPGERLGGQGRGRTADLPIFSRTLVPTELPGLDAACGPDGT